MTADELIHSLQAMPAKHRRLPVVSYELGILLVEVGKPRLSYRDPRRLEAIAKRVHERVIVL